MVLYYGIFKNHTLGFQCRSAITEVETTGNQEFLCKL